MFMLFKTATGEKLVNLDKVLEVEPRGDSTLLYYEKDWVNVSEPFEQVVERILTAERKIK